jgi:hypothetical protein
MYVYIYVKLFLDNDMSYNRTEPNASENRPKLTNSVQLVRLFGLHSFSNTAIHSPGTATQIMSFTLASPLNPTFSLALLKTLDYNFSIIKPQL